MTLIEKEAPAVDSGNALSDVRVRKKVVIIDGMTELQSLNKPAVIITCAHLMLQIKNFSKPSIRTNYGISTFKFSAVKIWESVPPELKSLPYMLFKKQYKRFLLGTQH